MAADTPGLLLDLQQGIRSRLTDIRRRLQQAAETAGRDPGTVRLLAVSKTFGLDHVRAAAAVGLQDLGENRVQEALEKIAASADLPIRWHLIGTLQANKAKKAAGHFAWIHSVDSQRLLERLDTAALEVGTRPTVLVQVDLAGEATKHGAPPDQTRAIVRSAAGCRAVRLAGLMTIPPLFDDPEQARPFFRKLRQVRDTLLDEGLEPALLKELSMGMSRDFEVAVQEGATIVRLGTAIFGRRHV